MAQTGYTPISIYYSSTASNTPTAGNLVAGELAINTADGKLFYKDSSGVVQVIGTKGGVGSSTTTQVLYNSSGLVVGSANMVFDGTNLTVGGYTTSTSFRPSGSTVPTNGMYLPASNSLGFATNSATAITISSTANVGFGVSPNWDTYTSVLQMPAGGIGSYVPNLDLTITQNAYYAGGWKYSGTGLSNRFTSQNGEFTFSNAITGTAGNAVTWLERMRIDSSGNLLVGTTSAVVTNVGSRIITSTTDPYFASTLTSSTNAATAYLLYSTGAAAYRFYVGLGGTIFATSIVITAISDERLKENIKDIDTGIDTIMALKPRRFDWKDGKGQDKKNVAGFIAQEFEQVFPECVGLSKAGADGIEYKNINHETLIPTLVKAIQELKAEIDLLKGTK